MARVPVQLAQTSGAEPHKCSAHLLRHREIFHLRDLYVAAGGVHLPQQAALSAAGQCLPPVLGLVQV